MTNETAMRDSAASMPPPPKPSPKQEEISRIVPNKEEKQVDKPRAKGEMTTGATKTGAILAGATATHPLTPATIKPAATAAAPAVPKPATATATAPHTPATKNTSTTTTVKTSTVRTKAPAAATLPPPKRHKPNPVLLADSHVVQTTHDILGLLQLYGPLSKAQLEYNLPPCRRSLQDILELLVATGVVQVIDTPPKTEPLYSVFGTTRADIVLPHQVLTALESAHAEYQASLQRAQILRHHLKNPHSNHPRTLLHTIQHEFPDIRNDPVYVAAMRNVGVVDISSKSSNKQGASKK